MADVVEWAILAFDGAREKPRTSTAVAIDPPATTNSVPAATITTALLARRCAVARLAECGCFCLSLARAIAPPFTAKLRYAYQARRDFDIKSRSNIWLNSLYKICERARHHSPTNLAPAICSRLRFRTSLRAHVLQSFSCGSESMPSEHSAYGSPFYQHRDSLRSALIEGAKPDQLDRPISGHTGSTTAMEIFRCGGRTAQASLSPIPVLLREPGAYSTKQANHPRNTSRAVSGRTAEVGIEAPIWVAKVAAE